MARSKVFVPASKVAVRGAGAKGRGVFASKRIERGEVIEKAPALLIPRAEVDTLLNTFLAHYIFRTDKRGYRYIVGLGFASLLNHSETPNAAFSIFADVIYIKAIKEIAPDSEITVAYGWTKKEWAEVGGFLET